MITLGLTGSIGMGKSTTAKLFEEAGCVIWDADAAVHRLYSKNGAAVPELAKQYPLSVKDGVVDRGYLRKLIAEKPNTLTQIEAIVHPLVARDRETFLNDAKAEICVFDIPLLFENKLENQFDKIICVTIDPETQKKRVLARGTMSEADFMSLLAKQMPDSEKQEKADYIIRTDTKESARTQVGRIIRDVKKEAADA